MSPDGPAVTATPASTADDEVARDAGVVIAAVALAPVLALIVIGFLGYSLSLPTAAFSFWHPFGQLVPVVAAAATGGVAGPVWPGALEMVGVMAWRVMVGGIATLALVGLTLVSLDLAGAVRCIPTAVLVRVGVSGRVWPRVIGFLMAATLAWSAYTVFLLLTSR